MTFELTFMQSYSCGSLKDNRELEMRITRAIQEGLHVADKCNLELNNK